MDSNRPLKPFCFSINPVIELIQKQGSKTGKWTPTLLTTGAEGNGPTWWRGSPFHLIPYCPAGISVDPSILKSSVLLILLIYCFIQTLLLCQCHTPPWWCREEESCFTRVHGYVNIAQLCRRAHKPFKARLQVTIWPVHHSSHLTPDPHFCCIKLVALSPTQFTL